MHPLTYGGIPYAPLPFPQYHLHPLSLTCSDSSNSACVSIRFHSSTAAEDCCRPTTALPPICFPVLLHSTLLFLASVTPFPFRNTREPQLSLPMRSSSNARFGRSVLSGKRLSQLLCAIAFVCVYFLGRHNRTDIPRFASTITTPNSSPHSSSLPSVVIKADTDGAKVGDDDDFLQRGQSVPDNHQSQPDRLNSIADRDADQSTAASTSHTSDPCHGRPKPVLIPKSSRPPSLYFLHIPKTAGTLLYHLVLQYANRTSGLACQFLFDGNRFGHEEYQMSVMPPPNFPPSTVEKEAVDAFLQKNRTRKGILYKQGACRTVRGHVTYQQRDAISIPVISVTVLRHPLERYVSMFEFAWMMVKTGGGTGWRQWLSGRSLEEELSNSTSLFHRGFYDEQGKWLAVNSIGNAFFFYGVLHQLSGINPRFEGVGDISKFRIANAKEMAEKAKDNICSTHILGDQDNIPDSMELFFQTLKPYATWTELERTRAKSSSSNKNRHRTSRNLEDHLSPAHRSLLEKRLHEELEVYNFAQSVIAYRKQTAVGVS